MNDQSHEIALPGCTPTPLAHYLKGLGVLRLVSEQADTEARAWWEDDILHLQSGLPVEQLCTFFLNEYRPTPLVAPWNGGSGFYGKKRQKFLEPLRTAKSERLSDYAEAINVALDALSELELTAKPDKDEDKQALITLCRSTLPDTAVRWMDAAIILTTRGQKTPPLLGSGGNDGNLEFSLNFMQRVLEIMSSETGEPTARSREWLEGALFDVMTHDRLRKLPDTRAIGQFFPQGAGGANTSSGFDGDAVTNPWDYILMLEGALLFSGSIARRRENVGSQTLSYPFSVRTSDAGYDTAAEGDVQRGRAETWLPLWEKPATFGEVSALFSEGRATVAGRQAHDGVDFARAIATLGVDRGISGFERFGYFERNGRNYFAVPLDHWSVPDRSSAHMRLIDELDTWLARFKRAARRDNAPGNIVRAFRRIQAAIMNVCRRDTTSGWQELLMSLGSAERAMVGSPKTTASSRDLTPLPSLNPRWLQVCDDGTPEYRLAVSLASIQALDEIGPLRANMVPLQSWNRYPQFNNNRMNYPGVVWSHGDLPRNLGAVLNRRCMDAKRLGLHALPLKGTHPARLDDISAFIYGEIDEKKLEELLWGLNAVWMNTERVPGNSRAVLPAGYSILKLVHLPQPLQRSDTTEPVLVGYDGETTRLALAGRMVEATTLAARRLRASGFPPAVDKVIEAADLTRRIAAALLFPISQRAIESLCKSVLLPQREPETA